ncbi:uncharacterized protein LOC121382173 [Gigantopelta aegis]|uniref:uncharacterized protein LOC121382173 n=1 Tax=Gigantopelta aegis TaxID=1735272 RepID=UPI001B88C970|nr:uncharacterized protein LOC121382173 [Gigantopelta aegis]
MMKSFVSRLTVWDNVRWITLVWTTLAVLVVTRTVPVPGAKTCQYSNIVTMQRECKTENEALLEAEESDNNKRLCESLHTFWFCVARNVPQCFYNVSVMNEHFTHSPHYCNLSSEQFLQLQNIIHSKPKDTTISLPASVSGEDSYETVTSQSNKDVKDGEHSNHKRNNSAPSSLSISYSLWTFLQIYVLGCLLLDYSVVCS